MKLATIVNKILKGQDRPILQNFLYKDSRLSISDFEMMLTLTYPKIEISTDREFLVDAKQLAKIIDNKGFLTGNCLNELELNSGKSKFKLPVYNHVSEFPESPELKGERIELESNFMESLKKASHCANPLKDRHSLNSIKLDFQNGFAVSTDQIRLSAQNIQKIKGFERNNIIIPLKAFKVLESLPGPDCIQFEDSCVSFLHNDYILTTRLVETNYPNYISAIESYNSREFEIELKREELIEGLKDLSLMTCENAKNLKLENSILSISSPKGDASYKIGETFHDALGINSCFLSDYLKTISKDENFVIGFESLKKPITIKDKNGILFLSPCMV